jgi:predicted double-glycine peptidase
MTFGLSAALAAASCLILPVVGLRATTGSPPTNQTNPTNLLLNVPFVAQSEALCGGAALAMVLRFWGEQSVGPEDFRPLVDNAQRGIPATVLADAVRTRGWQAVVVKPEELQAQVDQSRPAIALIEVAPRTFHYVVVVGVTNDRVVVHDPARAPFQVLTPKTFASAWRAAGEWMMVVLPPVGYVPPARAAETLTTNQSAEGAKWRELSSHHFSAKRYREAAVAAEEALKLDPADAYTRELLATSRYLAGDMDGSLRAWGDRPLRVESVDVRVAGTTPVAIVAARVGLQPRDALTADSLAQARHRLEELPVAATARVQFQPLDDERARVEAVMIERDRGPWSVVPAVLIAGRALVAREVPISFAGLLNNGERLSIAWRFRRHRPRLGIEFAVPSPGFLPGIATLDALWQTETYEERGDLPQVEKRRRAGLSFADWASGSIRWDAGAALDTFDRRRFAAIAAGIELRGAGDRLALDVHGETWTTGRARPSFSAGFISAAFRSSTRTSVQRLTIGTTAALVSHSAPLAIWPGADANGERTSLLRAHSLSRGGIITGGLIGRRLTSATAEYERPFKTTPLGRVNVAAFVDAAFAFVDVGAGLRIYTAGAGALRLDVAVGTTDGRARVSAAFLPAWPGRR